jgi:hypothetical protein
MDHLRQAIRQLEFDFEGDEPEKSAIPEDRKIWCKGYSIEGGIVTARIYLNDKLYDFRIPDYYGLEQKLKFNLIYNFDQFREHIESKAIDYERVE